MYPRVLPIFRSNLDPCKKHIDMEIWRELEKCYIKDMVRIINSHIYCDLEHINKNHLK